MNAYTIYLKGDDTFECDAEIVAENDIEMSKLLTTLLENISKITIEQIAIIEIHKL